MLIWIPHTTDHYIKALGISFSLLDDHGGWIFRERFTDDLQPALRTTGSLKHLSLSFDEILDVDRSICYAILSREAPKASEDHKLNIRGLSGWGHMIGVCFLYFPHITDRNTAQIGVALLPEGRGKGYGRAAVHKLLVYAFEQLKVHRVFAHIVCPAAAARPPEERKRALFDTKRLCYIFQKYGFQAEGVTRGAAMYVVGGAKTWQDIHRLSILDTDWLSMQMGRLPTTSPSLRVGAPLDPLEEMEQRHGAERREMLEWCENPGASSFVTEADDDDETYYCSDGSSDDYEDSDD